MGCLSAEREEIRAPQACAARHALVPRPRVVGVPCDRLALGRILELADRLPALLGAEPLTARYEPPSVSTHAAVSSGFGSTAPPSPGCHSMWSCGPLASPVDPTYPTISPALTYPSDPSRLRCA